MNWKTLSIAVAAIAVIGLILSGSLIGREMLITDFGIDEQEVNIFTGLFVAVSIAIVLVTALEQLINISWNGWQLGGVFAAMVFMIMAISKLGPGMQATFEPGKEPPLLLTQITFQCDNEIDQNFVYKVGLKDGAKGKDESVESIVVLIHLLQDGAKGKIAQILSEFKELHLVVPSDKDFPGFKAAVRKHIGTASNDTWIAYEVKLHQETAMRAVDMSLPIPLQAVGNNYPTVFYMKLNPAATSAASAATNASTAGFSSSATGVQFEEFAHMVLHSTDPRSMTDRKFDGLLKMKILIGVTNRKCDSG